MILCGILTKQLLNVCLLFTEICRQTLLTKMAPKQGKNLGCALTRCRQVGRHTLEYPLQTAIEKTLHYQTGRKVPKRFHVNKSIISQTV